MSERTSDLWPKQELSSDGQKEGCHGLYKFEIRFVSYADRKRKRFDDLVVYCTLVDHYLAGHV